MIIKTAYSSLAGPEDWFIEKDREFDLLAEKLVLALPRVMELVEKTHVGQRRLDGSDVIEHLKKVAISSENLAEFFYENSESVYERHYNALICKFSALLHEVMPYSGASYETIAAVSDKTVADCVSALTPMMHEPFGVRIELLVNRVRRCGAVAQIVKVADLVNDGVMLDKLIDNGGGVLNMFETVQKYIVELEAFLKNLHHIEKHHHVKSITARFHLLLNKLYVYVETINNNTPKKSSKRKQLT